MSDKKKVSKERKGGSFLHMDHIEWLLKDFIEDDRVSWVFEEENRSKVWIGSVLVLSVYLVFGPGAQLISNVVGFVYPAYCSIKALETKSSEDDTRWLTYWVVFSVFTIADTFSGFLLSWIPFYWLLKVLFLVWCFAPQLNGSLIIYNNIIYPSFKRHEKKIEKAMHRVDDVLHKASEQADRITETTRVEL